MAKAILVIGFIIAFAAGMVIGLEVRRQAVAAPATRPTGRGPGFLTAELNLSPEQQEQMKQIWSETAHRGGRDQEEKRRQIRKERDEAIAALIPAGSREQYDQALKTYTERSGALEREWRASFQSAIERTKAMLTSEQRTKYEEILKRHEAERKEREQGRRSNDSATSRPAATQ